MLGCQRSGTNALVGCFERDPATKAYGEYCRLNLPSGRRSIRDSLRYSLRLRPLPEVRREIERLPYPLAVLKPLAESHRIAELAEALPGARIIWIFRHYMDVAESNARVFGPQVHRRNLEPIAAADPDNWRSAGASEQVCEMVATHYRPDMDPLDGGALFWWARNQLLFDQGGEAHPGVKPMQYRRFVADAATTVAELYEWVGIPYPGTRITDQITPSFVGRGAAGLSSGELEARCESLWARLCALDPKAIDAEPVGSSERRGG